ncbi:MAG: hypothetical protein AAF357_02650 [Verrucomicrobiota bacterium]
MQKSGSEDGAEPPRKVLRSILKNEGEFFLIQGASLFFAIVAGFLLIRNLGMEGYGKYVLMLALGHMLSALGNSGLFIGASELVAKSDKSDSSVLRIISSLAKLRFRASFFAGLVVLLIASVLLHRIGQTSYPLFWSVVATLYYGVSLAFSSLFSESFMLLGKGKLISRFDAAFGIVCALSSIVNSWYFKDGTIVLISLATIEGIRACVIHQLLRRRYGERPSPEPSDLKSLNTSFWSLLPNVAFSTIRTEFVKLVLSVLGQAQTLGAFEGLRRIGRAMAPALKYLTIVIVPKLSRAPSFMRYQKICVRAFFFVLPPALLLLGLCYAIPDQILSLLGDDFTIYHRELRLVGWLIFAETLLRLLFDATRSRGWLYFYKRFELLGFLVILSLYLSFIDFNSLSNVVMMGLSVSGISILIAILDLSRGARRFAHQEFSEAMEPSMQLQEGKN